MPIKLASLEERNAVRVEGGEMKEKKMRVHKKHKEKEKGEIIYIHTHRIED